MNILLFVPGNLRGSIAHLLIPCRGLMHVDGKCNGHRVRKSLFALLVTRYIVLAFSKLHALAGFVSSNILLGAFGV